MHIESEFGSKNAKYTNTERDQVNTTLLKHAAVEFATELDFIRVLTSRRSRSRKAQRKWCRKLHRLEKKVRNDVRDEAKDCTSLVLCRHEMVTRTIKELFHLSKSVGGKMCSLAD